MSANCIIVFEEMLEELINKPWKASGGHLIDHACAHSLEEASHATVGVNGHNSIHNSSHIHLAIQYTQHATLLRVKQGFTDVEGSGCGCSYSPRNGSRCDMCQRVVASVCVDVVLCEFVENKVDALEGNVHDELSDKTAVESSDSLRAVNASGTVETRLVGTVVHLHALFHHCGMVVVRWKKWLCMKFKRFDDLVLKFDRRKWVVIHF